MEHRIWLARDPVAGRHDVGYRGNMGGGVVTSLSYRRLADEAPSVARQLGCMLVVATSACGPTALVCESGGDGVYANVSDVSSLPAAVQLRLFGVSEPESTDPARLPIDLLALDEPAAPSGAPVPFDVRFEHAVLVLVPVEPLPSGAFSLGAFGQDFPFVVDDQVSDPGPAVPVVSASIERHPWGDRGIVQLAGTDEPGTSFEVEVDAAAPEGLLDPQITIVRPRKRYAAQCAFHHQVEPGDEIAELRVREISASGTAGPWSQTFDVDFD